jgi:NhaP-type Na+/H+ or K+/H+ antiporter
VTGTAVVVVCVGIVLWVATARRLDRADVTAPMWFGALGLLAHALGLQLSLEAESIASLAEIALALVLFSDAIRIRYADLRTDAGLLVRLLLVALPLTVLAGTGTAHLLVVGVSGWAAVLVGASLAPTDAGLGRAIVVDPSVPVRIRQTLNAESGLNDGIATPIVTTAILAVAGQEGLRATESAADAARQLGLGVAFGFGVGLVSAVVLSWALGRRWAGASILPVAALAVAVLAYVGAGEVGGNGFLAVFVAGLVFRHALHVPEPDGGGGNDGGNDGGHEVPPPPQELTELGGELGGYLVWFVVGASLLPSVWDDVDASTVLFAVLSLTVLRMVPVALALLGSGLRPPSLVFIGWFGPRGLASVVFAMLAAAELGSEGRALAAVIVVTVALSVVAHGASASPLAARYGRWAARTEPEEETRPASEPVARGTMRR